MDTVLSKIDTIRRCIKRIHEEYNKNPDSLKNYTRQDSIVLNLQRACEISIDLANYINSRYKFGIPKTSRDSFTILYDNNVIDENISTRMKKMVGFRNLAIHDYRKLDLAILQSIIEKEIKLFDEYTQIILNYVKENKLLF